ncbi:MAG: ComEC/Rec2 family competence protein [Sphingobium sp.]
MAFSLRQTHVAAQITARMRMWLSAAEIALESEREQLGSWVPVALSLGIAAWFALPGPWSWAVWMAGCCGFAIASLMLAAGSRMQRAFLLIAIAAALGCALMWGKALLMGERPITRAAFVEVRGRVLAVNTIQAQDMVRLIVAPEPRRTDLPERIRVNVKNIDMVSGLGPGALLSFRSRLMPPAPPAVPGAYDFAQRAYFMGIGASGRALAPIHIIEPAVPASVAIRQRLSDHILARLGGGEGAIAATLATGDTGAISQADADAMRRSGLAHLLSISGLHVSAMIGGVIFLLLRIFALSRRLALRLPLLAVAAGGGALAGVGYTLLTGAEVPTVRSCVAALLVLAGLALGRDSIGIRLIAAGAIVVLVLWPESLVGPSFQMSFMAVIVLVSLSEAQWFRRLTMARDEARWRKWLRALTALFITGLAVEAALMPIALYHFHQSGMLGAFANLIAIPLTTFVVMPAEAAALFLDIVGLGAPLWWIVGKALGLLLVVAHFAAAQSAGVVAVPGFSDGPFVAALMGLLWVMLWRTRVRLLGLVPLGLGSVLILLAPAPDILVTGDGRHMAVRGSDGRMMLLRGRAGDYVRDTLGSVAGEGLPMSGADADAMPALAESPQARCNPELCAVDVQDGGRSWRILATRSAQRVPWKAFVKDCANADIVVSDRRLPRGCIPRWLKLDRAALSRSGGAAIYLGSRTITTVRPSGDTHPWIVPPAVYVPHTKSASSDDAFRDDTARPKASPQTPPQL